jgi:hypothetical protein
MRYKELDGKDILDEDYGALHGFYLGLGYRSNTYIKEVMAKPYLEAYFRNVDASIKYKGRWQNNQGNRGDFSHDRQQANIQRFGLKIGGYTEVLSDKGEVLGYLDVGERIWKRSQNEIIDGVSCYAEKYDWTYFGVGLGFNYAFIPEFSAGADVEWMFVPNHLAKMRADLGEGGTFGIKNVHGAEVKLPLKYHFAENFSFDLTPFYTYWKIGESDLVKIGNSYYYEPDSKTHIGGIMAGLTYSL